MVAQTSLVRVHSRCITLDHSTEITIRMEIIITTRISSPMVSILMAPQAIRFPMVPKRELPRVGKTPNE